VSVISCSPSYSDTEHRQRSTDSTTAEPKNRFHAGRFLPTPTPRLASTYIGIKALLAFSLVAAALRHVKQGCGCECETRIGRKESENCFLPFVVSLSSSPCLVLRSPHGLL
jgi:hypothetical protein